MCEHGIIKVDKSQYIFQCENRNKKAFFSKAFLINDDVRLVEALADPVCQQRVVANLRVFQVVSV